MPTTYAHFSLMVDATGQPHIYCSRARCPWIKPLVQHMTLQQVERVAARHRHPQA